MYDTKVMVEPRNVPDSRVHMNSNIICNQNHATFPIMSDPMRIYSKDDVTITCVNNTYYYRNKAFQIKGSRLYIDGQWIELPDRESISTVERLLLSLGMIIDYRQADQTIDISQASARVILSRLTTMALRDMGIIGNINQLKLYRYGEVVFDLYLKASNGSGRISSRDLSLRWLNEQDTLQLKAKFFTTTNLSYQVGVYSMEYAPTQLAENVFDRVFSLLLSVDFMENQIEPEPLDFIVPITLLREIRLRDTMMLLGDCIGYHNGFVIRPILRDYQYSRVYSVFTSISSETRKQLGFINYDIGSALQTICMHLVKDSSIYPLHQQLVQDRHGFRQKIADEANKDIAWVKKELTSADNRETMPKRYNSIPTLKAYFEEALILRKEVIATAEPTIHARASECAKCIWEKEWDDEKQKYDFIPTLESKESSLFFFIWTQWERQIREVMMSCFDDPSACHQVHDAIYTKEVVDPKVIEENILQITGFRVSISRD